MNEFFWLQVPVSAAVTTPFWAVIFFTVILCLAHTSLLAEPLSHSFLEDGPPQGWLGLHCPDRWRAIDPQSTLSQLLLPFPTLSFAGLHCRLECYSVLPHAIYNVPEENPLGATSFLALSLTTPPLFFFFFAFCIKDGKIKKFSSFTNTRISWYVII